jgi:hypothetical protein
MIVVVLNILLLVKDTLNQGNMNPDPQGKMWYVDSERERIIWSSNIVYHDGVE